MEKTASGWSIIDREAGVLSYEYRFAPAGGTANTFAARCADGKMLVISPALGASEELFQDLLKFGDVGAMVANNGFHHLGQAEWRKRFPTARAFAAPESVQRIRKKNPDVGEFEPMGALQELLGPNVGVAESPATKCGETWAWVKIDGGYAWFTSDIIVNMAELPPNFFLRALFRWTHSAPGFRIFHLAMKFTVKDKKRVLRKMLDDMRRYPPTAIVPAHGGVMISPDLPRQTEELVSAAL